MHDTVTKQTSKNVSIINQKINISIVVNKSSRSSALDGIFSKNRKLLREEEKLYDLTEFSLIFFYCRPIKTA